MFDKNKIKKAKKDEIIFVSREEFKKLFKEDPVLGKLYKDVRVVCRGEQIKLIKE